MASAIVSSRLDAILQRENLVLRDEHLQDKCVVLASVARMFDECDVPYAIMGGLAVQLYNIETRSTVDIDIAAPSELFAQMRERCVWSAYGFQEMRHDRVPFRLFHATGNVKVEIYPDSRFAFLLENPETEMIGQQAIRFGAPLPLTITKLRTQRSDWPRDQVKRMDDRVDLMRLLSAFPGIEDSIRRHPLTNNEMRQILHETLTLLAQPWSDDLPPDDVPG